MVNIWLYQSPDPLVKERLIRILLNGIMPLIEFKVLTKGVNCTTPKSEHRHIFYNCAEALLF